MANFPFHNVDPRKIYAIWDGLLGREVEEREGKK
jgi:hypothetical protein